MQGVVYKHGDILTPNTTDTNVIVCHQVNCMGVMGAGLAKQVRQQLPNAYEQYKLRCSSFKPEDNLGTVLYLDYREYTGYILANCFGQLNYGRNGVYTNYKAIRSCLENVSYLAQQDNSTVRIPYLMGCGLAGGNWDTLESIIRVALINRKVNVEIWSINH